MSTEGPEGRWLDAEELRCWQAFVHVTMPIDAALNAQLRRDAGISHFEYGMLSALSKAPGRTLRMSTLAEEAEGSLPRLSQVATRLEAKGWVRRYPDPNDGRFTLATLTDDGLAKLEQSAPGHLGEVRRQLFDALTKSQVRQLTTICERIERAKSARRRDDLDQAN
ncbi:MAG: MarR family winged helix-turn-helix transcriptional regulator [Acidimicrobiales bacterium]